VSFQARAWIIHPTTSLPSFASSLEDKVVAYRCYFERVDHVPTLETIECDQDGEAITHATSLLDARPEHWGMEVWKDARLLARISRNKSPDMDFTRPPIERQRRAALRSTP
jgi:hypothetical protein